jgi:DNA-directed RNA polymerase specialized sigma24 family protein
MNNWSALSGWRGLYSDEDWHPHSLAGLLKKITVNKVKDLKAADGRGLPAGSEYQEVIDNDGPLGVNPEEAASDSRDRVHLRECIEELQRKDRNLLYLWRQGQRDSYSARLLDMNANNVRQRRHYLLQRLRECVENKRRGN